MFVEPLSTSSPLQKYDFYGASVLLEFEPDLDYLGMRVIPKEGYFELGLIVPGYQEIENFGDNMPELFDFQWRYRTSASSGSRQSLMSGFASRFHNAAILCYPANRAREAILQLMLIAMVTVKDVPRIRKLIKKQAARFPAVYAAQFVDECFFALKQRPEEAITLLRKAVGRIRRS